MRVYIQIVDKYTGIYQCGVIDEPAQDPVENAIKHFNVGDVKFQTSVNLPDYSSYIGEIIGTSKVITIIKVVSDQPSYLSKKGSKSISD